METNTVPVIQLAPFKLRQDAAGRLWLLHEKLREPVELDPSQLRRWLHQRLRETVAL
jgi:hypothetical protein